MSKRHLPVETADVLLNFGRNVISCKRDVMISNCGPVNAKSVVDECFDVTNMKDRIKFDRIWSPTSSKRSMAIASDQSKVSDSAASISPMRLPIVESSDDPTCVHTTDCSSGARLPYSQSMPSSLSSACGGVSAATNILPFLYLGSHQNALSENVIKEHGITHVLNISTSCTASRLVSNSNFLRIPVNDTHNDRLLPFFQQAFQFIESVQASNGCVLVHCLAGVSRSPTVVIAFVMYHLKLSMDEAYRFVKSRRPCISPNFNFLGQLMEYEAIVRKSEPNICEDIVSETQSKKSCCTELKSNPPLSFGEFHSKKSRRLQLLTESIPSPTTALAKLNFNQSSPLFEIPQSVTCFNSPTEGFILQRPLQLPSTNSTQLDMIAPVVFHDSSNKVNFPTTSNAKSLLYNVKETELEEPPTNHQADLKMRSAQFLARVPLRRPNSIAITSFHFDMPCSLNNPQVKVVKDKLYEVQRQHSAMANNPATAVVWNESPLRCKADILVECRDSLLQQVEEACKSRSLEDILMLSDNDIGCPKSLDIATTSDFLSDRIDIGRHWKREGHESSGSISSIGSHAGSMHGSLEIMQVF